MRVNMPRAEKKCRVSILCVTVLVCSPVLAAGDPEPMLEEVLVTATKAGLINLQKTPLAVTSISADELELSNIRNLTDLNMLAPSIAISQNNSSGQLYIRGIGTNNIFAGGDPSSTIHLDGVYLSRPASVFTDFLELERIEVLRGPQGTLYGRNATGGTINLITQKPSSDFYAKASLDLGSYSKSQLGLVLNGSLGSDKLSANLALSSLKRDGYIDNENPTGTPELNDQNRDNVRAALRYTPTETLTIDLAADYFERDETPPIYKPSGEPAPDRPFLGAPRKIKDFWAVDLSHDPSLNERIKGFNSTIDWQISERSSIKSITGYRELKTDIIADTDYSEQEFLLTASFEDQNQTSQEFQYHYNGEQLSAVAGVYFYGENLDAGTDVSVIFASINNILIRDVDTRASAVFADFTWKITDQWSLLAGGRYSDEEKEFSGTFNGVAQKAKDDWTDFSPKIGAQYDYSDSAMAYATITQGFKSGGYNYTAPTPELESYDQEELTSYEIGVKVEFPDQRTRLNSSIFFYDYTDLQVLGFGETGQSINISNASDAEITGLEAELLTNLTDAWRVTAAFTLLSTEYKNYKDQRTGASPLEDLSGNTLNSAPESSFAIITDYSQSLAGGTLLYRAEYRWQDKIYFTAFNDDITSQDAYGLLNASVTYDSADNIWQMQVYAKNLTNEEYSVSALDFPSNGVAHSISEPLTAGVKATYRFE